MNVFDLYAKISLDTKGYEKDLEGAKSTFSKFGEGLKSAAGKVGDVLAGIGKTAAVGIGAAGTALTALTKQSLGAVANYEQLVGGVDTLFKDASKKVQEYANRAYMDAGLSANEYMETTIQFSASLIQGLKGDTETAADIANMAIIDMADNVNKMGTTMEMVQNAYRGLARQNFTMLDNLALGYQGTADEMARLINDSKVMGDTFVATGKNIKNISFDKYIEAIHVIQKEMGITGTTADEAAGTITGSAASVKAAWQNFLTGTGTAEQFTKVLKTSVDNIKKNLKTVIPRLTEGLQELAEQIAPEIPPILNDFLPVIITGASGLLTGLAGELPSLIKTLLPSLAEGVVDVSVALVGVMPQLVSSFAQSIPIIVQTIMEKKDDLLKAGKDIVDAIVPTDTQSITKAVSGAAEIIGKFATALTNPDNTKKIMETGFGIINSLANGLTSKEALNEFLSTDHGAPKIIENLGESLVTFVSNLADTASTIITNIADYLCDPENEPEINRAATMILMSLGEGFVKVVRVLYDSVVRTTSKIMEYYVESFDGDTTAEKMIKALGQGFINAMHFLTNPIGTVNDYIKELLGVDSREELDETQAFLDSDVGLRSEWDAMTPEEKALHSKGTSTIDDTAVLTAKGMRASGHIPSNMGEEYLMRYAGKHATGFYAKRPAFLTGDWVGENGDEVLLPLDRNDGWADKLAEKIGGGGVHVENINVSVQFADSGDDATIKRVVNNMINEISEQLADLQGRESRGLGLGYRGGTWA